MREQTRMIALFLRTALLLRIALRGLAYNILGHQDEEKVTHEGKAIIKYRKGENFLGKRNSLSL